ncbi:restriction endonuclease subunit S [Psychrobacter ciconiae]|uniref:restriction endonuclease subunit S n=1 Tax=Psychrobacter ciconiae TaxID=1553449 RepID=UPI0019181DC1|nr:restriction endonuclease subunit S [Psychrobacter ciconiae]
MRKGWKHVTLGDLIHIKHGYGFKGEFFVDEPSEYVLVTPGNFAIGGGFKNNKLKYYDGELKEDFILKGGDVIVTMTDLSKQADTLGFSAKVPNDNNIYLHNQRIGLISILSEDVVLDFIYWLLRTEAYQKYIAASSTGATVKHTSPNKIYSTKLIIPSCKRVQQKIANILSAYDDLIENNTKRIELLEEQAQLIYEEWFVRMRFPNHKNTQIDAETGLPEGWTETRLKNLGQIITGKTPSTINTALYNGDIPFIKTPDMGELPYVIQTNSYLSKEGALSQKNKFLPKNSLLVSCIGTAGVCALTSRESQCNQQINAIKFDSENMTFFTYCFAKNLKPHLEALGSNGATMTNVNKNKFENIKIITPSLQLLNMFHEKVSLNFEVILLLIKQNQKLKEARDILLPRLMMGIIEV